MREVVANGRARTDEVGVEESHGVEDVKHLLVAVETGLVAEAEVGRYGKRTGGRILAATSTTTAGDALAVGLLVVMDDILDQDVVGEARRLDLRQFAGGEIIDQVLVRGVVAVVGFDTEARQRRNGLSVEVDAGAVVDLVVLAVKPQATLGEEQE